MTLIDYAKYLLNVCGRRFTHLYRRHYLDSTPALPSLSALLSYLKTQTASIFTQIKARGAVHPLSGLPTTETLATLTTALATLSTRKVDVGSKVSTSDNLPEISDGECLPPLLCCSAKLNRITELFDKTTEWIYDVENSLQQVITSFISVSKVTLNCASITNKLGTFSPNASIEIHFPKCTLLNLNTSSGAVLLSCGITENTQIKIYFEALKENNNIGGGSASYGYCMAKEVYLPSFEKGIWNIGFHRSYGLEPTKKIYIGCKGKRTDTINLLFSTTNIDNLEDIELGQNARQPITISYSVPGDTRYASGMTRETIRTHIIDRLADNRYEYDGITPSPAISIILGSLEIAKLTSDDLAVAYLKNYTLA